MAPAGGSSQRKYDRLRAKEKATQRQRLPIAIVMVVAAPVLAFFGVHLAADILNPLLTQAVPGAANGTGVQQLITPDLVQLLAPVAAFSAFVGTARLAWGRRATTEAWATGAVGERRTAALLVPLERKGWVVLHDRKMPRSRANIDHVAIGPAGVFAIETKQYSGTVKIGRKSLFYKGRCVDKIVEEAQREGLAVQEALADRLVARGVKVRAVICVHGAQVETASMWTRPVVDGVAVCSGRRLGRLLSKQKAVLDASAVAELGRLADERLRPCVPDD